MSEAMAATISRVRPANYSDILSWVAPGLTHRSFILARGQRAANNVPSSRQVGTARLDLVGANDLLPPDRQIECMPTPQHCADAIAQLSRRLQVSAQHAKGVYARGGANATPLALPELLDVLTARLSGKCTPARAHAPRRTATPSRPSTGRKSHTCPPFL